MKVFFFILILFSTSACAETFKHTGISIGTGYTYASPFLGVQFSQKSEISKVYVSAGLIGYAIGFETSVTENNKHTLGVTGGQEFLTSDVGFAFVTYSYHFNALANSGFVAGLGAGFRVEEYGEENDDGVWDDTDDIHISPALTLTLGYNF